MSKKHYRMIRLGDSRHDDGWLTAQSLGEAAARSSCIFETSKWPEDLYWATACIVNIDRSDGVLTAS